MALDYKIIGERLKQARLNVGLTQEKLSEKLGMSVAFLSRIERGDSRINLPRLNQICTIVGVAESYILNGASEESTTYLDKDFAELLKDCPPDKLKLIYNVAKTILGKEII